MKLGIVVRADDTGLGNQTRELVNMLDPERILVIDSSKFHNRNPQHMDWYDGRNVMISKGSPDNRLIPKFVLGLDAIMTCETFYNNNIISFAKRKKVKTILQYNFEFLDHLSNDKVELPDVLMAPSMWRFEEVKKRFGDKCLVTYLPPPTNEKLFEKNKNINKNKSNRLLHIGGKAAMYDRNGTNSVIEMLRYSKKDYQLIIKSQTNIETEHKDERLIISVGNEKNNADLYSGYDAMILPRRYAGLCLPMNESLLSGLPVFMTDISPNNFVLPKRWLAESYFIKDFMARVGLQLYGAAPEALAEVVDNYFSQNDLSSDKEEAYSIGYTNFSAAELKQKYIDLFNSVL